VKKPVTVLRDRAEYTRPVTLAGQCNRRSRALRKPRGTRLNADRFLDLIVGAAHSALGTILGHAASLRADVKRSFREGVENLLSWALNSPNRSTDELMHGIEGIFV
jgi:hypothetical protein